ncbi:SWI/SNF complex subunit SWI3D [Camellia lanceoleosa]|uniref:SWI/SNF complex subunit SWI3D n=1 Tax=Camellia lanceoleosa TaxID=1840588 RepID=A0ACC0G9T4_9ERIC|nr:SWI/SNF complex subunit SWI3D [Camellia lanceoleosa]
MKGILSADSVLVAQADYDLCTECFNNGKLDSGWSPTDFILMEPAEAAGVVEHVATKTKAQCILHFVQMPIEDAFMDCDNENDASVKENTDTTMADNDSSAPKETPEILESRTGTDENQPQSSPMEIPKPEDASELKADQKSTSVFQNHFQNMQIHFRTSQPVSQHADQFQNQFLQ